MHFQDIFCFSVYAEMFSTESKYQSLFETIMICSLNYNLEISSFFCYFESFKFNVNYRIPFIISHLVSNASAQSA